MTFRVCDSSRVSCVIVKEIVDSMSVTPPTFMVGNPQLLSSQTGTYHRTHRLLLNLTYSRLDGKCYLSNFGHPTHMPVSRSVRYAWMFVRLT